MFEFDPRDEGFRILRPSDGRMVASLQTTVISVDDTLKIPKQVKTPIPREEWIVHFAGVRLTPGEVKALVEEIAKLS